MMAVGALTPSNNAIHYLTWKISVYNVCQSQTQSQAKCSMGISFLLLQLNDLWYEVLLAPCSHLRKMNTLPLHRRKWFSSERLLLIHVEIKRDMFLEFSWKSIRYDIQEGMVRFPWITIIYINFAFGIRKWN